MADAETSHAPTTDAHDDHAAGHSHEEAGEPLGPVDTVTWAYAVGGGLVGLLVAAALFVAISS